MHHVEKKPVRSLVATVSDTRTVDTDKSGRLIKELLHKHGHECVKHEIVPDELIEIDRLIEEGMNDTHIEAILLTGGTGISARDVTIEVVQKRVEKEIPGFGELFRMLSYTEDIGSAALMSRAVAGVKSRKVVFAMPGSSGAVKLAMEKLILPEISHILHELHKDIQN